MSGTGTGERISLIHSDSESTYRYETLVEVRRKHKATYCRAAIIVAFLLMVLVALVTGVLVVVLRPWESEPATSSSLTSGLQVSSIMSHLQELQKIADVSSLHSRSVANGYNRSAEYVSSQLKSAGLTVRNQEFRVAIYEDLIPDKSTLNVTFGSFGYSTQFVQSVEFSVMRYSGSGEWAALQMDIVNGSGCNLEDYDNAAFMLALVDLYAGNCSLYEKADNARAANVSVLVLMRDKEHAALPPSTSRVVDPTDSTKFVDIPVLGASYDLGMELMEIHKLTDGNMTLGVKTSTSVIINGTYNVLASTATGNHSSIIVMGSHLDSVPAGPGINDNGSGSAMNLELALLLAELVQRGAVTLKNQIIFAFWGAEELGLFGSKHFVSSLGTEGEPKREDIVLDLNFDMVASPNYIRGIYNGSGANEAIRPECETIQKLFQERFEAKGLSFQLVEFDGRSDYGPFISQDVFIPGRSDYGPFIAADVDIPAGGLFTGAEVLKTVEERKLYGGLANAPYDPCYHQSCDTIDNINQEALAEMSDAAAYVLQTLMVQENLRDYLKNTHQGAHS